MVAYFSLADEQYEVGVIEKGNTQISAEMIAEQTGADTFSIERAVAYLTTYDGLLEISREEESNPPEIAGTVGNMDDYSVIFIGYPIWLVYHNLIQCTQAWVEREILSSDLTALGYMIESLLARRSACKED